MTLEHHEVEELLGAYALDAVDPDEAEAIEDHLRTCPRCQAEVADHREVASLLVGTSGDAPDDLWDRIAADLGEAPPPVSIEVAVGGRARAERSRRRSGGPRWAGLAAAAAVVVLALLGAVLVDQRAQLDDLQDEMARSGPSTELAALLSDPDSQVVDITDDQGEVAVRAVVGDDGDGLLLAEALPTLPASQTYQLWGVDGDRTISLGVLGAEPRQAPFHVEDPVATLAVTAERAGGASAPTSDPLASGALT